jgi:hypothetical protein
MAKATAVTRDGEEDGVVVLIVGEGMHRRLVEAAKGRQSSVGEVLRDALDALEREGAQSTARSGRSP